MNKEINHFLRWVYLTAKTHLLEQNEKARGKQPWVCVYLNKIDHSRCAIGGCIDKEFYDPIIEGATVASPFVLKGLFQSYNKHNPSTILSEENQNIISRSSKPRCENYIYFDFLLNLQKIHDGNEVLEWPQCFEKMEHWIPYKEIFA